MKKLFIRGMGIIIFFLNTIVIAANNNPILCNGKQILGGIEKVILIEEKMPLDAKLDTGARMASLSATSIEIIKRDNKDWVKFSVQPQGSQTRMDFVKPLIKFVHILKRKEESNNHRTLNQKQYGSRPVVAFLLCIGNQTKMTLVNLIDRTQFRYPMLLGSSTLEEFHVLVDVSQNYLSTPKCQSDSNSDTQKIKLLEPTT